MASWQVQQAKSHLSELLDDAETKGPQVITRHGKERAVVLSIEEYRALKMPRKDFIAHLLGIPKFDFEIERSTDTGRDFTFDE